MSARSRRTALMLLLLTFFVGGMSGMAVEEALGLDWFDFLDEDAMTENPGSDQAFLIQLGVDADQRSRIENIFRDQDQQLEAYWRGQLPALHAIVEKTDARIDSVLTPEQRAAFKQRIKNRGSSVPAPTGD